VKAGRKKVLLCYTLGVWLCFFENRCRYLAENEGHRPQFLFNEIKQHDGSSMMAAA